MISAFINAYNEEEALPELFTSLKGIDDIVLIDHQSTDNTAKLATELGARVFTQEAYKETVTQEDVDDFQHRFGFLPTFKADDRIYNWAVDFNRSLKHTKHDWVLYVDCDERVKWDLEGIKALLPTCDVIRCKFITEHNEDSTMKSSFFTKKLFNKTKTWFVCHTHTAITGYLLKEVFTDKMTIDHFQKPREYRKEYLPQIEFAFFKEQSSRMNYYLARQYFHSREFEKSLQFFKMYLETATIAKEISKAYTLMSGSLWELGKIDESFVCLFQAMRFYPHAKLPFIQMANMIEVKNPENAGIWRKFADQIQDEEYFNT